MRGILLIVASVQIFLAPKQSNVKNEEMCYETKSSLNNINFPILYQYKIIRSKSIPSIPVRQQNRFSGVVRK